MEVASTYLDEKSEKSFVWQMFFTAGARSHSDSVTPRYPPLPCVNFYLKVLEGFGKLLSRSFLSVLPVLLAFQNVITACDGGDVAGEVDVGGDTKGKLYKEIAFAVAFGPTHRDVTHDCIYHSVAGQQFFGEVGLDGHTGKAGGGGGDAC